MLEAPAAAGQFGLVSSPRFAFPTGCDSPFLAFPEPTGIAGVRRCYAGITNKAGIAIRVKFDFYMPRKKYPANVVGPQIRKVRGRLGLTQKQLAAQCQLAGLDISRSTLGQIEARLRYVSDEELIVLASLLGVTADQLYPEEILKRLRARKLKPKSGKTR